MPIIPPKNPKNPEKIIGNISFGIISFGKSSWRRLLVKQEPTLMKNLSGAPLWGRFLALPTNNTLGWNGLPGTNTLAYY
jgi:hypothetical protein